MNAFDRNGKDAQPNNPVLPAEPAGRDDLPDHAAERDERQLPIEKVGIRGLRYPIRVEGPNRALQSTIAEVELAVNLPHDRKGTHMSRFIEILNAYRMDLSQGNLSNLLGEVQRRLNAEEAHISLSFPYFIKKVAPVSRVESLMEVDCLFAAKRVADQFGVEVTVHVPVTSLCPCSKAVSERGAHNQRSMVTVRLDSSRSVCLETVVEAVEGCASAPLYALLKREDEKFVTEQAYDNPRFAEDLVRNVVLALRVLPGVTKLHVSVDNQESIHNHAAFAEIHWEAGPPASVGPESSLHLVDASPNVLDSEQNERYFGAWLRETRQKRGFRQQDFAEMLGVSGSYLSRVENGSKSLSIDVVRRMARVLGLDPVGLQLRAGLVPTDLLGKMARDPDGFRRWADSVV